MGIYDGTRAKVQACQWWDRRDLRLCPLYNDCCDFCLHPDAPRDEEGHRMACGEDNNPPKGCPLRQGKLELELVGDQVDG